MKLIKDSTSEFLLLILVLIGVLYGYSCIEFFDQTIVGIAICLVIYLAFCIYILIAYAVASFYDDLLQDFNSNYKGEKFDSEILNNMQQEFINSVKIGTKDVNSEVIISKNIPPECFMYEWFLKYLTSLSTLLGLFGTFFGLTGAIGHIKDVLSGLNGINITDKFITDIREPLKSVSTVFWASISGIFFAIVMNLSNMLSIFGYRKYKRKFYDEVQSYFDNALYAKYAEKENKVLVEFTLKMEESMKYMTDMVTETFSKGLESFGEKIISASQSLKDSVDSFNEPILSFKESIDNFKVYYEGFEGQIFKMDGIITEVTESFNVMVTSINSNRNDFIRSNEVLNESMKNLDCTYKEIISMIDIIKNNSEQNNEFIEDTVKDLRELYDGLWSLIGNLREEVLNVSYITGRNLRDTFRDETGKISKEVEDRITLSLSNFDSVNKSFINTLNMFSERIYSIQKLAEKSNRQSEEKRL